MHIGLTSLLRGNEIIRTFMYKAVERKFGPKVKISGPGWKVYEPGMKIIRVSVLSLFYIEIYTPGPEEIPPFPSPLVRPGNAFIWKSLVKYQMALKPANCNVYQLCFSDDITKREEDSANESYFRKTSKKQCEVVAFTTICCWNLSDRTKHSWCGCWSLITLLAMRLVEWPAKGGLALRWWK